MRKFLVYFLTFWALAVVTIGSVAGLRGSLSRKPPLEVFPDMKRQLKLLKIGFRQHKQLEEQRPAVKILNTARPHFKAIYT